MGSFRTSSNQWALRGSVVLVEVKTIPVEAWLTGIRPPGEKRFEDSRKSCSRREVVRSGTFPVPMIPYNFLKRLVRPERFELPTPCFVGKCSIQLSYGRT